MLNIYEQIQEDKHTLFLQITTLLTELYAVSLNTDTKSIQQAVLLKEHITNLQTVYNYYTKIINMFSAEEKSISSTIEWETPAYLKG